MIENNNFINFGDYLKKVRLEKNLALDKISMDIKISIEDLKALEDSNIESFPNEVLTIGFLRTYSEYLGIDIEYISNLFKDYKNRLNNSYIGIKVASDSEEKRGDSFSNINFKKYSLLLIFPLSLLLLFFILKNSSFIFTPFSSKKSLEKGYKIANYNLDLSSNNIWNLSLKNLDNLTFTLNEGKKVYLVKIEKGDLILSDKDNLDLSFKINIGRRLNLDLFEKTKLAITYDVYSSSKKEANLTVQIIEQSLDFISESTFAERFNILNWDFQFSGPELSHTALPTVYRSDSIKNLKVLIKFLEDSNIKYANDDNLTPVPVFSKKGTTLTLELKKALIIFLSRLSDVEIFIEETKVNDALKGFGEEFGAYQFFWFRVLGGNEIKVTQIY